MCQRKGTSAQEKRKGTGRRKCIEEERKGEKERKERRSIKRQWLDAGG